MVYKETPEEIAAEGHDEEMDEETLSGELSSDEELEFEGKGETIALEGLDDVSDLSKSKTKPCFSLKARRAIEDHLEKRRMRKELDYLFDDGFAEDDTKPNKES